MSSPVAVTAYLTWKIDPPEEAVHAIRAVDHLADNGYLAEPTNQTIRGLSLWCLACNTAWTVGL